MADDEETGDEDIYNNMTNEWEPKEKGCIYAPGPGGFWGDTRKKK